MSNTNGSGNGNGNDEVMTGQVATFEESEEQVKAREEKEAEAKRVLTWEEINIKAEAGEHPEDGGYEGEGADSHYVSALVSIARTVSDSGYEIASQGYSGNWKKDELGSAFRLFKRNSLGDLEYTPWIPVPTKYGNMDQVERQAMAAYMGVLKTGKLPEVDRRGRLKSTKQ